MGTLNLVKAFVPVSRNRAPETDGAGASNGNMTPPDEPAPGPFVVNLKAVEIADVTVDVEDRVPARTGAVATGQNRPVRFGSLHGTRLRRARPNFPCAGRQDGQIQAGGAVTIAPLALDMAIQVKNMDVRPFQPYLSEQAGLIVTQGFFNTQGRMGLSQKPGAAPVVTYTGKAGLNRFASIDRKNANDFLKWDNLLFDNLEVGVNPTRLSIEQISLADFFARVIVDPDGSVNLVSMFSRTQPAATAADQAGDGKSMPEQSTPKVAKPPIRIARVTLSGGDVDFSDHFIKPNYSARFQDLGGQISGLESIAEQRADVMLEGMWGSHAPVKITGQINPLIDNPYVDLNLNITDIELSPFSPYSGKYIGYILEKGKLTFNVAYLMENRQLEA